MYHQTVWFLKTPFCYAEGKNKPNQMRLPSWTMFSFEGVLFKYEIFFHSLPCFVHGSGSYRSAPVTISISHHEDGAVCLCPTASVVCLYARALVVCQCARALVVCQCARALVVCQCARALVVCLCARASVAFLCVVASVVSLFLEDVVCLCLVDVASPSEYESAWAAVSPSR